MPDPTRRRTVRPIRPVVPGRMVDVPFGGKDPDIEYLSDRLADLEGSAAQIGTVDLPEGGFSANDVLLYVGGQWTGVSKSALLALNDLTDVVIGSPADDHVLQHNGTQWINALLNLTDLGDVAVSGPATTQTLRYNGTTWVNAALALDDLSDVQIAALFTGQTIRYDGTKFINDRLLLDDLLDVSMGVLANKQVITYDTTILLWRNLSLDVSYLSDFTVSGAASGDVLTHNGTAWINRPWVTGPFGIGVAPSGGTGLWLNDAADVVVGTTTGTKIGTATTQKLGFFNATPVVKPAALTAVDNTAIDATYDATEQAVLNNVRTRLNEVETKLQSLGLLS